jgi:putative membrane protein
MISTTATSISSTKVSRPVPDQSESAFLLASRQASLAFERTFMTTDRTLMSVIQASLSLIGFGFALVLFFHQLATQIGVDLRTPARNFGISLVVIGVGLVTAGLIQHQRLRADLRDAMDELHRQGQLTHPCVRRRSPIAVVALLLLLTGLLVMLGIVVRMGPFG